MQPVLRSEILELSAYEATRDETRTKVLGIKKPRRIALGPNMTLLLENTETIRYQIQEMVRVERIEAEEAIAHEIATYNELLPRSGELSGTLFIEYVDTDERDEQLRRLLGLETDKVHFQVGKLPPVAAIFDERQISETRLSSVHYIRFSFDEAARKAFRLEGLQGNVQLTCTHEAYPQVAVLMPEQVNALALDLAAG